MRRFSVLALLLGLVGLVLTIPTMANDHLTTGQEFATNTPRSNPIVFATNTPRAITFASNTPAVSVTPSNTATETLTPTVTFTATPSPTMTPTDTMTPSPTPTPNGPYIYPDGVNSLTGLPYPNEEAMYRRNLIVKISNYPPVVRPQSGLNLADVVFEMEAEGGVTRFAAIFRTNAPTHVGSVRSARLGDMDLQVMFNALLAYSGTSEPIQNLILASDYVYQFFSPLKGDNCENAGFCRFPDEGLDFEHTLYLDTTILYGLAERRNVNTPMRAFGFSFADEPDEGGDPIQDIYVEWYGQTDARWQYSAEDGVYRRWTDGQPHYDVNDGEQLWTNNVVVLEVPHVERPDLFPTGANYESIDIQFEGQGRALVFRDGQQYIGYWIRQNENPGSALQLVFPGAPEPIRLHPGKTYVEVVRGLSFVMVNETLQPITTKVQMTPIPDSQG